MPFYSVGELVVTEMAPGIFRRSVYLDRLMVTFFRFDAGAEVPDHAHPHEQITYVVRGALQFTLDGETRVLKAGEGATIPAGMRHRAIAIEPTEVLDAWSPIRDDYR